MQLSKKQSEFLEAATNNKNIFLSGKAGTGKSFVVKLLFEKLEKNGKNVIALAPTGVAAKNINGQTIHSMFNINPYGISNWDSTNWLKGEKRRMLDAVDTIIIDEVSMVRPDILDAIHWTLIKNGCDGLNTKQVIFVGDLKQLSPVLNDNSRSVLYQDYDGSEFFNAKIYSKLKVINVELDEVLRQSDEDFIHNLNIVREGGKSEYFRQFLNEIPKGIVLAPLNKTVDRYNKEGLEKIDEPEIVFEAKVTGNAKADDFNLETVIRVKNGCKIMYLINSKDNPLINGTMGLFFSHSGCHYIRVDNVDYALQKMEFTKKEYVLDKEENKLVLQEIGTIYQYPIRLAYALTIHKSQGLTFDEVTVDLRDPCNQPGQLYVALSRVRTPNGLNIIATKK